MLTESLVIATEDPPKQTNNTTTGIFLHEFQPTPAPRQTFKKSSSKTNCLVVNQSHVFAAQLGKAVVHVYSRDRSNQEALIPFSERITALTLVGERDGGHVLVLGTAEGRIILWEVGNFDIERTSFWLRDVSSSERDDKFSQPSIILSR